MTKNRYTITGITRRGGKEIEASCIAYDIISAIEMFKEKDIIVYTVPSREQVNANMEIGIEANDVDSQKSIYNTVTWGEFKETSEYKNAEDVSLCVNGNDIIDDMYYPEELDQLQVIGVGYNADSLMVDIVCKNWDKRHEIGWVAR